MSFQYLFSIFVLHIWSLTRVTATELLFLSQPVRALYDWMFILTLLFSILFISSLLNLKTCFCVCVFGFQVLWIHVWLKWQQSISLSSNSWQTKSTRFLLFEEHVHHSAQVSALLISYYLQPRFCLTDFPSASRLWKRIFSRKELKMMSAERMKSKNQKISLSLSEMSPKREEERCFFVFLCRDVTVNYPSPLFSHQLAPECVSQRKTTPQASDFSFFRGGGWK